MCLISPGGAGCPQLAFVLRARGYRGSVFCTFRVAEKHFYRFQVCEKKRDRAGPPPYSWVPRPAGWPCQRSRYTQGRVTRSPREEGQGKEMSEAALSFFVIHFFRSASHLFCGFLFFIFFLNVFDFIYFYGKMMYEKRMREQEKKTKKGTLKLCRPIVCFCQGWQTQRLGHDKLLVIGGG